MTKKPQALDMKELARLGAVARLADLEQEIAALKRAFPGLRSAASDSPATAAGASAVAAAARHDVDRRGRRKPMTGAERKAVSERMKKYWAERKRGKE
jgi:hypothetical protein